MEKNILSDFIKKLILKPLNHSGFFVYVKLIFKIHYFLFAMYLFFYLALQSQNETLTESTICNDENNSNYTTRKMDVLSSVDSEK